MLILNPSYRLPTRWLGLFVLDIFVYYIKFELRIFEEKYNKNFFRAL